MSAARLFLWLTFCIGLAQTALGDGLEGFGADPATVAPPERFPTLAETAVSARAPGSRTFVQAAALAPGIDGPTLYPFYPVGGTLFRDVFTVNYVDLDPSSGFLDFECGRSTYDGHSGSDTMIRSFGEMDIGVPVFAVLDGTVIDAHDGEFDRNTIVTSVPPNYVAIDHGNGRVCWYLHLRQGSVGVWPGQTVRCGQQIGMVGSSGSSNYPHLHFASYQDGAVYEPFAGPCRSGASGWQTQPAIDHSSYLQDFGVTFEDLSTFPGLPNTPPRSGQIALSDASVSFWCISLNLPAASSWRVKFQRPDSSIAMDSGTVPFNNPAYRWAWFRWSYDVPDMHAIAGTWHILLDFNGVRKISAPVEVRPSRTPDFNRPPQPIQAGFEPATPGAGAAVFCRVNTDLLLDDLDYDIVRYDYTWTVNGRQVRHVVSAGQADAIPAGLTSDGDTVACSIIPSDGKLSGQAASVRAVIGCVRVPADFDGDCDVDAADAAVLISCMTGSGVSPAPECANRDLDGDIDVDQSDYGLLQRCLSGQDVRPDPNCAG